MHRAFIIANGGMEIPPGIMFDLQSSPLIIAADGGTKNCKTLGIQPHVIVGDLDSIDPGEISAYRTSRVQIIQHPSHKDETDLELAIQYAIHRQSDEVIILGGLGDRWDMTIANILLLAHPSFAGVGLRFLDGAQEVLLLRSGYENNIHGSPGDTLSLIPLSGDADGITARGLEYTLVDESLKFGTSRGVSNVFSSQHATISFRKGLLLCVLIRKNDDTGMQEKGSIDEV